MPSLNAERFIDAAISSITKQTHRDWELVVVDGGSTDKTLDIVKDWARKDGRIQQIDLPKSTIYEAILAGFSVAKGQVLSWLNADDLYDEEAFSNVDQAFQSDAKAEWITGRPSIIDPAGEQCCVYPHSPRPRFLIQMGVFNPNFLGCIQAESTFFKAELFERLSDEDKAEVSTLTLAGDFLLWRKLARFSALHQIPEVVGGFRIHGDNASLIKASNYREEVAATGAWCFSPKMAYLLQKLYRMATFTKGFAEAEQKNRALNESLCAN